jgi:hypothetical protein
VPSRDLSGILDARRTPSLVFPAPRAQSFAERLWIAKAVQQRPEGARLPAIATLAQTSSSVREATSEQWLLGRGKSRSRGCSGAVGREVATRRVAFIRDRADVSGARGSRQDMAEATWGTAVHGEDRRLLP